MLYRRTLALDDPGYVWGHSAGAHGRDLYGHTGLLGLEHLAVAQVEGFVLAAGGAPEQEVAALGLRRRDLAAGVVLSAGVAGKQNADAGEGVTGQARAVESDSSCAGVDSAARPVEAAPAPLIGNPALGSGSANHVFDGLCAVDPVAAQAGARIARRAGQPQAAQEFASHVHGGFRRVGAGL